MTTTADKAPTKVKVPREEDPRNPVSRLTAARAEQVKGTLAEAAHKLTTACGGTPPVTTKARKKTRARTAA